MLNWISRFSIFAFLEQPPGTTAPGQPLIIAGAGALHQIQQQSGAALDALEKFRIETGDWAFGHFSFDLKAETAAVGSTKPDPIGFADLDFFVPRILIRAFESGIEIAVTEGDPKVIAQDILAAASSIKVQPVQVALRADLSREEYLAKIEALRSHIHRGDCYEINFCQAFRADVPELDPLSVYTALTGISPNPFSALYRQEDAWLCCTSPERFLRKQGNKLISEPMKGTRPRILHNPAADAAMKTELEGSAKDRAENIMVVDLVRNDLSHCCLPGSVQVEELCTVYAFPQVYQMISRVTGVIPENTPLAAIIRPCFPMGSMTGAPKKRVLELIEQYEPARRGLFSGALGYFAPGNDFDFNVVIRSLLYNAASGHLQYLVGSGITYASNAEKEYEECDWKAAAIRYVMGNKL